MQQRTFVTAAMLIGALALVASGCGSKKKNYSASKAEYAAAVSSICAAVNAKNKKLGISSIEDIAAKGDEFLANVQEAIKKSKGLGDPPAELKSYVDDYYAQNDKAIPLFEQMIEAAKANDAAKVQSLGAQIGAIDDAMDVDSKAVGSTACLSG